jgi:hypothetical protein
MALDNIDALWDRLIEELDGGVKQRKMTGRIKKGIGRNAVETALSGLRTQWYYSLSISLQRTNGLVLL